MSVTINLKNSRAHLSGSTPFGIVPKKTRLSSIMWLGDSITQAGGHLPQVPMGLATQPIFPGYPNINALGLFIILTEVGPGVANGAGTLRYYAATASFTWQAAGDTEGVPTQAATSGFYTCYSGTGGANAAIYFSTVNRFRPIQDKADTVTVNTALYRFLKNNTAAYGFTAWSQLLLGPVFSESYCYGISTIKASEWLAAKAHWQSKYTDLTCVCLGTNDISDQASAVQALKDVTDIVNLRIAIGSTVIVGCLFPYDSRTAAQTAAVLWFNRGLRELGEKLNIDVFDAWNYLANPAGSGGYAAGMSLDQLHPSGLGGYIIAKRAVVPILKKYVAAYDPRQFAGSAYNATTAPYGNLLVNGQLLGVAGTKGTGVTGEVPTGWTCIRNSGSVITAVGKAPESVGATSRTDGQLGKYATVTVNNAGGVDGETIAFRSLNFVTTGFAAGDWVVIEGDLRLAGTAIQFLSVYGLIGVRQFLGITPQTDNTMGDLDGDTISIPFRSAPLLIQAGDTNLTANILVGLKAGGTAVLDIGQTLTIHKVPAPV